jgi:hypothetical protein
MEIINCLLARKNEAGFIKEVLSVKSCIEYQLIGCQVFPLKIHLRKIGRLVSVPDGLQAALVFVVKPFFHMKSASVGKYTSSELTGHERCRPEVAGSEYREHKKEAVPNNFWYSLFKG